MAVDELVKNRQLSLPDTFNDQLSGEDIEDIESTADHMGHFLWAVMSQFKRIIHGDDVGNWTDNPVEIFGGDASLKALFEGASVSNQRASLSNKAMAAQATSSDGDLACDVAIAATPSNDGYVRISINGLAINLGDGVKTTEGYFSNDGGATARDIADIASGDLLYWNGSVAKYELSIEDIVDFEYSEDT